MVSELSEALEALRERGMDTWYEKEGKPEGVTSELADCIIRILDTAAAYNLPLEEIMQEKMTYNKTRPHKHGKAF